MNKTLAASAAVIALLVVAGGLYLRMQPPADAPAAPAPAASAGQASVPAPAGRAAFDARNATFTLDGQAVSLKDGLSNIPSAPGSASLTATRYIGHEARGDLNGDGQEDVAFMVTQDGGGSGLFYYAVAAIKTADGYKTTNGFLIGDRIAPQSIVIPQNSSELQVNFADRKPGEPMSAPPSVASVLLLKVTPQGVLEGLMK